MRNLILSLLFALCTPMAFAAEIEATVVFENLTGKELTLGEFTIITLNKTTKITKAESFKITLSEEGKYQFSFVSNDFIAYTFYPARINKNKNTITIRLKEKNEFKNPETRFTAANSDSKLTIEQIENRLAKGTLNFIMHGIDNTIPEDYLKFKEKYGIGVIKKNCVLDPLTFKKTAENNQMIFDYLNQKYGTEWLNDLKSKPFGIK